jgi:hypothetical protein
MAKFFDVVSALVMAALVAGIAFFSAPVWVLLIPLRFAIAKVADASEASCVPQQGFRYLVPAGLYACLVAGVGVLYTAAPVFASLVNGIGIAIGLLPGSYF